MEIRKTIIGCNKNGEPIEGSTEREYIFFKVKFNKFRNPAPTTENIVQDSEDMQECECVLTLPKNYSDDGEPTPLILSCHGAGSRVCEEKNLIGGVDYVRKCIDAGYAALDVSGSEPHGTTMGCPEHIFALYKAYRYAVRHYNLEDRVLLSGASMGGQTAINFANTYPSVCLAIGIFFPRLNIDGVTVDSQGERPQHKREDYQYIQVPLLRVVR